MKPFVLLATRDHDKAACDEYESVREHAGLATEELIHIRVESGPLPTLQLEDYRGCSWAAARSTSPMRRSPTCRCGWEADIRAVVDAIVDADFPFLGMCTGSAP